MKVEIETKYNPGDMVWVRRVDTFDVRAYFLLKIVGIRISSYGGERASHTVWYEFIHGKDHFNAPESDILPVDAIPIAG